MGKSIRPLPVKLVIGLIFSNKAILNKTMPILKKRFGPVDFQSQTLDFSHTNYYEKEFGKGLKRSFISFGRLIAPDSLARIKNITNSIERKLSKNACRLINIDPGYLDLPKLILASTKDYNHRIYIGKGIFAEITLFYEGDTFKPWQWTYPDYRTDDYIKIFNQIRKIYTQQIPKK